MFKFHKGYRIELSFDGDRWGYVIPQFPHARLPFFKKATEALADAARLIDSAITAGMV